MGKNFVRLFITVLFAHLISTIIDRSENTDYKGSGYDRGHLAAAGNHKVEQKHVEQTFFLSNMAPQVGVGFNRDSWNKLEKHVRKLTNVYKDVYVCTGPLYLPKYIHPSCYFESLDANLFYLVIKHVFTKVDSLKSLHFISLFPPLVILLFSFIRSFVRSLVCIF